MNEKTKSSIKFSITIAVITLVLAAIFSSFSSSILSKVSWLFGLLIVFLIVLIGILFDMLGIAATAAKDAPLHAMAAEKVKGAKEAVFIHKHADKFASFCNDVIGDISGIVSGSAITIVIVEITHMLNQSDGSNIQIFLNILLPSVIAAVTVGGKAISKFFAVHSSTSIILLAGKVVYFMDKHLKIKIVQAPKGKSKK